MTKNTNGTETTKTNHGAFQGMASLTNVTFASNNVTRIGNQAFQGCSILTEVKVPKSLTSFGNNVFGNSSAGSGQSNSYCTSLTTIDLSATQVTSLPTGLFQGCTSLSNVKLPSGLTTINESAFQGATSLTAIDIPSSVTSIGDSAFGSGNADQASAITALDLSQTKITSVPSNMVRNCASLTEVKLPSTVTSIGDNAFKGTTLLKTLTQEAPAASETAPGSRATGTNQLASTLTYIGTSAFQGTGLESIDLSETKIIGYGVNTSLGNSAFQDAASLSDVTLPTGLTTIPAASFAGTTALKNIEIPKTVTTINAGNSEFKGAFEGSGLESIDLSGTGVTGVASNDQDGSWPSSGNENRGSFSNMPNLTTVTLPAGLTGIPKDAFANSAKLATVKFGDASANTPSAKDVTGDENTITLPTGLTTLGNNAFAGTAATAVDLSKVTGLTTIGENVFRGMTKLAEVKLPASITTINANAFQDDAALKTLSTAAAANGGANGQVREETTPVANTATFGSKLTTINQNAFQGTGFSIVDLSLAGGTSAPSSGRAAAAPTPNPLNIGLNAFTNMPELATVKLPANANINPTYFGNPTTEGATPKLKTIQYGTDSSGTGTGTGTGTATATLTDATISSPNFSKIKNQVIEIKSSVGGSTINFNGGVFNGNETMTTLKLSLVTGTRNGNNPLWKFNLGTAPTADNTEAAYATAPLGNNSALKNIELSGLLNTQARAASGTDNQFDTKIEAGTWGQVASIMNMFSSGTGTDDSTKATNLDPWAVGKNGIDADLTQDNVKNEWALGGALGAGRTSSNSTSSGINLETSTTAATLTHNGVNWKYSNKAGQTTGAGAGRQGENASTTNAITIEGKGIKIYKAMNGTNGYQTYIKNPNGTTGKETSTGITVTITLVPNNITSSGPQTAKK